MMALCALALRNSRASAIASIKLAHYQLFGSLDSPGWPTVSHVAERLRPLIEPLAAHYLLTAKGADGKPLDPIACFHLGNGARLEQINWLGDLSAESLRDGAGITVNYVYDLDEIEKNHEAFASEGEVVASAAVKTLAKSAAVAAAVEIAAQ